MEASTGRCRYEPSVGYLLSQLTDEHRLCGAVPGAGHLQPTCHGTGLLWRILCADDNELRLLITPTVKLRPVRENDSARSPSCNDSKRACMFVRAWYILFTALLRWMILCRRATKISKSLGLDPRHLKYRITKRGTAHLGVQKSHQPIASMYNNTSFKDRGILPSLRKRQRQPLLLTLRQMPINRNCIFSNCNQNSSLPISNTTRSWVLRRTSRCLTARSLAFSLFNDLKICN